MGSHRLFRWLDAGLNHGFLPPEQLKRGTRVFRLSNGGGPIQDDGFQSLLPVIAGFPSGPGVQVTEFEPHRSRTPWGQLSVHSSSSASTTVAAQPCLVFRDTRFLAIITAWERARGALLWWSGIGRQRLVARAAFHSSECVKRPSSEEEAAPSRRGVPQ